MSDYEVPLSRPLHCLLQLYYDKVERNGIMPVYSCWQMDCEMLAFVVVSAFIARNWVKRCVCASSQVHRQKNRNSEESELIPGLPNDFVISEIWPRVVQYRRSSTGIEQASQVLTMREVNVGWRDMVDKSNHMETLTYLLNIGHPPRATEGWTFDCMMSVHVDCMEMGIDIDPFL